MYVSRIAIVACALAAAAPVPALAQAGAAGGADAGDIVVTARRVAEKLQDVPVAVTAISGDQIQSRNLTSVAEIQALTPSINFTTTNGGTSKAIVALRGQRQSASGLQVDPSVGVYINEVYMARSSIDTSLFDLENVQVLKGPQGTLFGRNTTGGAVLLTTKRPTDRFEGYVNGRLETPWGYGVDAAVNLPLGDGIALRVAGSRQYHEGYTKVVNLNRTADNRNRWGVRGSLSIKKGALDTLFVVDYYKWEEQSSGMYPFLRVNSVQGNATTGPFYAAYNAELNRMWAANYLSQRKIETNIIPASFGRNFSATNVTSIALSDSLTLKNVISFAGTRDEQTIDFDGTAINMLSSTQASPQHQFTEELQLQGKSFDNTLDWIVGGYYFDEWGSEDGRSNTFSDANTTVLRNRNLFYERNVAGSVFAHGSWLLPVGVPAHLFGGVRRGFDTRRVNWQTGRIEANNTYTCLVAGTVGQASGTGYTAAPDWQKPALGCNLFVRKNFNSTTWDVGVDVKPTSDLLLYGSVSRGFRTGGFNGRATTVGTQIPYNPEDVTNYELGAKFSGDIGGGMRATLNLAAYHSTYNNIQQSVIFIIPGTTGALGSSVINAAKGEVNGFEIEANLKLTPTLTIAGFYGLTDAKFKKFEQANSLNPGGPPIDLSANKFAGVPSDQWGVSLGWDAYEADGFGTLHLAADYRWQSAFWLDPINRAPNTTNVAGNFVGSYGLANASIELKNAFGSRASVQVFAKNLFDKMYQTGGFSTLASGYSDYSLGAPRVVGLAVRLPFGAE